MATGNDGVQIVQNLATPIVPIVPVNPHVVQTVASAPVTVVKGDKPEKFSGKDFKRWQQKMMFYLTTLNLVRFLTEERPKLKEG